MSTLKNNLKKIPGSQTVYAWMAGLWRWLLVAQQYRLFRSRSRAERPSLVPRWKERQFFIHDRTQQTHFDRHHVYHTAWAVRQLQKHMPQLHVDISSSLYFVALGSAIVPIRHLDYRPPMLYLENLECGAGNLMALPFSDASVESLSCMHVIEHIGLARYGDQIDPLGDVKAAKELSRVLAPNGRFYFVAPIGRPRVCFNGHRIYSFKMVRDLFPNLELTECALIPDKPTEGLVGNPTPELFDSQQYGCGCFVFRRRI